MVDFHRNWEYNGFRRMEKVQLVRPCIEMTYPEFAGCYALLKDGRVTYVGKSINVLQRLIVHRNRLKRLIAGKHDYRSQSRIIHSFDSVRMYPCPTRELDSLERELILLHRPEGNTQIPTAAKVINIVELARRANVDLDKWRNIGSERYPLRPSKSYRRVA